MAGRKKGYRTPDEIREKIQGSMLINRLQSHIETESMSMSQVNAAKALLNKVIPDLKAVEHSGSSDEPLVMRIIIGGDD